MMTGWVVKTSIGRRVSGIQKLNNKSVMFDMFDDVAKLDIEVTSKS